MSVIVTLEISNCTQCMPPTAAPRPRFTREKNTPGDDEPLSNSNCTSRPTQNLQFAKLETPKCIEGNLGGWGRGVHFPYISKISSRHALTPPPLMGNAHIKSTHSKKGLTYISMFDILKSSSDTFDGLARQGKASVQMSE